MFENPNTQTPILSLAHDENELSLDDIMSCVSADDLRRVARARKVPPQLLATRESVMKALRNIAHNQTTLSFTRVDRKGKGKAGIPARSLTPGTSTSERLVLAQLMPCLGGQVIQIDQSLYTLVSRVNLIFSRTPPTSAYTPALLLPPILVTSHRRQYPEYGTPTRSVIWKDRRALLDWEHAVHYEALVSEVLGDNWAEQRRGGGPVQSLWRGQPISRTEGAKLVRRVWENVWPQWKDMVAGKGGEAVDPKLVQGGLASDRFKTAHVLTRLVAKVS
jgi:Fanconi-associated nuclease 1